MRLKCWVVMWILCASLAHAEPLHTSFAMNHDPHLPPPAPVKTFHPGYLPLWLQALARPEADMQRLAAESMAQAHEFGFPGMAEARPRLLEIVAAEKTHPTARFAAARCLIVLESRDAAPTLFKASQKHGADLRQLIEPALGKWKFEGVRDVWRARIASPESRHRDLLLAVQGLAQLGDSQSAEPLTKIVHDLKRSGALRVEAAKAAGQVQASGLEPDAANLLAAQTAPLLDRLCAAHLLSRHDSSSARKTLLRLAVDQEPAIATVALTRLLAINPDIVLPIVPEVLKSPDAVVRQRGADAYIARPTPERLIALVTLLNDPHPNVRYAVREALYVHTRNPEFDTLLRPEFMKTLEGDNWRGQEQAALLLATLDHKAAAPRFLQLLDAPRDEVMTTVAWGLRKLAVPETLPAMLEHAQAACDKRKTDPTRARGSEDKIAHLFEAMALLRYEAAESLFRQHVPKNFEQSPEARGAAIWGLSVLHENKPDEALFKTLAERAADVASVPPEMVHVQAMSSIALGRMGAKSQLGALRALLGKNRNPHSPTIAAHWAIIKLSGEPLSDIEPFKYSKSDWFLSPLDSPPPASMP